MVFRFLCRGKKIVSVFLHFMFFFCLFFF